jgi:hypothetical protein
MPRKMARPGCPTAVRAREMVAAVGTARRSCRKARKATKSAPPWGSSGESLLISERDLVRTARAVRGVLHGIHGQ